MQYSAAAYSQRPPFKPKGLIPNNVKKVSWCQPFNPITAGAAYIRVFIFYYHTKYHLLNMLKIKYDINQQYLKTVDLHIVKSE